VVGVTITSTTSCCVTGVLDVTSCPALR
jgi:hypothetical protein